MSFRNTIFYALMAFLLAACSPMTAQHGHMNGGESAAKLIEQAKTREQVLALLGTPSSTSTFGEETWYYISSQQESIAFLSPEVVDQEVLAFTFDETGRVKEVEHYGLKEGRKVAFTEDVTPTEGHSLGLIEQLLGNLGRFNTPKDANNIGR